MFSIKLENKSKVEKFLRSIEKNIKKNIRVDAIENGLDDQLKNDLKQLKDRLRYIVNSEIRSGETVSKGAYLDEPLVKVPKSDEEIIKQITGLDLTKFRTNKEYTSLIDSNVALIYDKMQTSYRRDSTEKGGHSMSAGVNIRIPMDFLGSFDSQLNQAVEFFNRAMFIDIDNNGNVNYLVNPGIDLRDCVKIVCSTENGDTVRSRAKFEQHRGRRGYADWTLKKECVEKIKKNFVNLSDVIDKIKEADFDEAVNHLGRIQNSIGKNQTTQNAMEQISNMKEGKNLDQSVQSYTEVIKLIRNMRLSKRITKTAVTYSLVSSTGQNIEDNFMDQISRTLSFWKISKEKTWVNAMISAIQKSANKTIRMAA